MADFNVVLKFNDNNLTTLNVDKGRIENFSSLIQSSPEPYDINFDLLANSGSIVIVDTNEQIKQLIEADSGILQQLSLDVYLNGELIQSHTAHDANYNIDTKELSLSLSNNVANLENINYQIEQSDYSVKYFFEMVLKKVGFSDQEITAQMNKYIVEPFENKYMKISDYLNNIQIPIPYFERQKLTDIISKLSEITLLNITIDDQNKLNIVSSRPVFPNNQSIINIPQSKLYSPLDYSIIKRNPIGGIEYTAQAVGWDYLNDYYIFTNEFINLDTASELDINKGTLLSDLKRVYPQYAFYSFDSASASGLKYIIGVYDGTYQLPDGYHFAGYSAEPFCRATYKYNGSSQTGEYGEIESFESLQEFQDDLTSHGYICKCGWFIDEEGEHEMFGFAYNPNTSNFEYNSFQFKWGGPADFAYAHKQNTVTIGSGILYNFTGNELLQLGSTYKATNIIDSLYNIITADYANGLNDTKVDICCSNLYDTDGNLVVNYDIGETLKIGDIVTFENDEMYFGSKRYWKVTSREFYYDAAPYLKLELLQVNGVDAIYQAGLYYSKNNMTLLNTWNELLDTTQAPYLKIDNNIITGYRRIQGYLVVENGITGIGTEAFRGATGMSGIELPDTVTSLGQGCFVDTRFSGIKIPNSITALPNDCFYRSHLKTITLPNTLTQIGDAAFMDSYLESVELPSSLVNIGQHAFMNCRRMTEIVIPSNVSSIGEEAFSACDTLQNVVISNGVQTIGVGAFAGCTALTSIDIPSSVTDIQGAAFNSCTSLTTINIRATSSITKEYWFLGVPSSAVIHIPSSVTNPAAVYGENWNVYDYSTMGRLTYYNDL